MSTPPRTNNVNVVDPIDNYYTSQPANGAPQYDLSGYVDQNVPSTDQLTQGQAYDAPERGHGPAAQPVYLNRDAAGGEAGEPPKKGLNRYFKTRRRMYLCLYCLISLILLAIMLPVTFFVIVPAVAQSAINGSKMVITSTKITAPNEDGFTMKMSATVTDTGPFDATIEFSEPVKIIADGEVLGEITMPPMVSKAGVGATVDASAPFKVVNKKAFGAFAKKMMTSESFVWQMDGKANVKAMGLTLSGIKVVKDLPLKGMNNFPKVEILSFDLPSNHPSGGIMLKVQNALENPSPIAMEVGDMYFDMVYNNTKVGEVIATGVTLNSGRNVLALEGRLIPLSNPADLASLSDMMSKYMKGEVAMVSVVGTSVRPNNNTEPISWLLAGFKGTTMTVPFPGAKDLKLVTKVEIGTMSMVFTPETAYRPLTGGQNVGAFFKMPFNFPLEMKRIAQNITMIKDGNAIATISSPMNAASGSSATGKIVTGFEGIRTMVIPGQERNFQRFVSDLSNGPSAAVTMSVNAVAVASTAVGDLTIDGMKFSDTITLKGLNGLQGAPIDVTSLVVKGGTREYMEIEIVVNMNNPSNVAIQVGRVQYDTYFEGQRLGWVVIPDMSLKVGSNSVRNIMYFSPQGAAAVAAGRKLMSGYLMGRSAKVGMRAGSTPVTPIASLQPALSSIQISTVMPGLTGVSVMRGAYFGMNLRGVFKQTARARFDAYNPLDTTIRFLAMDTKMFFRGESVGNVQQDLRSNPLVIPPKSVVSSAPFELKIQLNAASIKLFGEALKNTLQVDVQAVVTAAVGDYVMVMDFVQNGVKAQLG